ncbi:MAG: hypothetical protein IKS08_01975 [Alphaproteobacteria bacterium]|nr:hypothetical protein [Alphaproteobacteria bacterium]
MVTYSTEKRDQDEYYRFNFSSKNYSSDKILVKRKRLSEFMYCLSSGIAFHDDAKTVTFDIDKDKKRTTMHVTLPNKSFDVLLFDDEKDDLEKCIRDNKL